MDSYSPVCMTRSERAGLIPKGNQSLEQTPYLSNVKQGGVYDTPTRTNDITYSLTPGTKNCRGYEGVTCCSVNEHNVLEICTQCEQGEVLMRVVVGIPTNRYHDRWEDLVGCLIGASSASPSGVTSVSVPSIGKFQPSKDSI